MPDPDRAPIPPDPARPVELALRRLGYSRVPESERAPGIEPAFWVREPGVPRRLYPVFIEFGRPTADASAIGRWISSNSTKDRRAIVVVPNDVAAEEAWRQIGSTPNRTADGGLAILVVPSSEAVPPAVHWHARIVPRSEVLRLSTGIVVGMFRRAQSAGGTMQIDFEELLTALRQSFGIDVHRSLGVQSDEDALFLIYQMATRFSYAPGDAASNLHLLVLKPTGPAARLPWFAA